MSLSLVFQNIDPPPATPSPPGEGGECVLPPNTHTGGTHSPGGEGGGGSIFWKTRDIGLPSYSNNLSTAQPFSVVILYRLLSSHDYRVIRIINPVVRRPYPQLISQENDRKVIKTGHCKNYCSELVDDYSQSSISYVKP